MAIHYENYARFSKGQGYIGSACRAISGQARTKRWFATDCRDCKNALRGRQVISRDPRVGFIERVEFDGVWIKPDGDVGVFVFYDDLDKDWAPLNVDDIFASKTDEVTS